MLSILHICTDFWPSTGGIQQFVMDMARKSTSVGLRVTVLCFNRIKGFNGTLPASEVLSQFAVRRIPFINLVYYKPAAIPLSLLKSHNLIHVHGIGAPLDYVALMKWAHRRPIVLSTHGGIFHTHALHGMKRLYFYKLLPWIMRRVDVVVAGSESDASLFKAVSKRVTLVEDGVFVEPYLALSTNHKQRGRCLSVGRLSDNKGVDLLLRAASVARDQGATFCLRLVGPDVEGKRRRYEDLATTLGIADCVTFVGGVSNQMLLKEYELADTFVSASQHEGFGIAAMEAKAAGCRLLLHNNDAFRSLFRSDAAAFLVDFRCADLAGAAFASLMRQPRDPNLRETRRQAEAYSWDRKFSQWLEIYQSLTQRTLQAPRSTQST